MCRQIDLTMASLVPSLLERSGLLPRDVPLLRFATIGGMPFQSNHKCVLLTRVVGEKISVKVVEDWGNDPNGLLIFNACTSLCIVRVYCWLTCL